MALPPVPLKLVISWPSGEMTWTCLARAAGANEGQQPNTFAQAEKLR